MAGSRPATCATRLLVWMQPSGQFLHPFCANRGYHVRYWHAAGPPVVPALAWLCCALRQRPPRSTLIGTAFCPIPQNTTPSGGQQDTHFDKSVGYRDLYGLVAAL